MKPADRILWSLLARARTGWREVLVFVKPSTVVRWQRKRFKAHWRTLSQSGGPGRPPVADDVKELIRTMSSINPTWGSPRIVGELAKLGISVNRSSVDKYKVRVQEPPSSTWRAFLKNHARDIVSIDFMVVQTVRFQILHVLLFLSVERRRIIHFAVTEHPSEAWAAHQVVEAFPWDTSPKYTSPICRRASRRRPCGVVRPAVMECSPAQFLQGGPGDPSLRHWRPTLQRGHARRFQQVVLVSDPVEPPSERGGNHRGVLPVLVWTAGRG